MRCYMLLGEWGWRNTGSWRRTSVELLTQTWGIQKCFLKEVITDTNSREQARAGERGAQSVWYAKRTAHARFQRWGRQQWIQRREQSLAGELQDCIKHEARDANHTERVGLYSRSRRLYNLELYVQNYMLEKALWLWREWDRMESLETRIKLGAC